MPRVSGNYSLPAANPVVTGTTIEASWANTTMADVAAALTDSIARDGQTAITANLPMSGFRHTGVGDASARNHYGVVSQIQDGDYTLAGSVTGTNTVAASLSPTISAYVNGMRARLFPANANTGAVTLALNGLTARSVVKFNGVALVAGDLAQGVPADLVYDLANTRWVLQNPQIIPGIFGNITISGNSIVSTDTNGDINVTPNGSGALNLSGITTFSSRVQINDTTAVDLSDSNAAFRVGAGSGQHLELDGDDIQSKSDGATAAALNLNRLGGNVNLGAQSGSGSVRQYFDGALAFVTTSAGAAVYSSDNTEASDRYFSFRLQNGTRVGLVGQTSSGVLLRNEIHGGIVALQAEDTGGTVRNLIRCDPNGEAASYFAGTRVFGSAAVGTVTVYGDDNTDTDTRLFEIRQANDTRRAFVGHAGSDKLRLRNEVHGGLFGIEGEDAGGTARTMIECNPNGGVSLYEHAANNEVALQTQGRTDAATTTVQVRHRDTVLYDVGLNVVPRNTALAGGNETFSATDVGRMEYYDIGTARSLFLNNDSDIPEGSMAALLVGPSAGTLTIDAGAGVTLRYWNGAIWTDTSAGGTVTAGVGQYTIWKDTDTLYWITGPNLS